MDDAEILLLMSQALASEFGIEIAVSDVEVFKRRFYAARAKVKDTDPDLSNISLNTCPTDPFGRVWLTHKRSANGTP